MFRFLPFIACGFMLLDMSVALAAPVETGRALRQVAGILEYIAGDYRQAVGEDGRLLQQGEYDEQRSLAAEAEALVAEAGLAPTDALRQRLTEIREALRDKRSPSAVARLCRDSRQLIVEQHGVRLSPEGTPSREDGARLYVQQGCANCHGVDGRADTEAASKLTPRPANFLDPERVSAVSPMRAFHAISFGLAGTGMQGFPQLRDAERWSLAFYVLSLRHAHADMREGKASFERSGAELPSTAAGLSALTEEDILHRLAALDDGERARVLAYLRAEAPFVAGSRDDKSMAEARRALHAGVAAYRAGDKASARQHFVSAYLDGFEPHEAALAARDRMLVRQVERDMLALRSAVAQGETPERIAALAKRTEALLARAEGGSNDATTALLGALTITLREGLEISLLIGALLGLVRKRGRPELAKYVHGGWVLAAFLGLLTWLGLGELLSGMQRELAEGIATLVAAAVLLGVTHWLLGQLTSKRFMGFLVERMGQAASSRTALGILGLSFIAAYREAFEIVLFFKALLLDAKQSQRSVWLGALLGIVVLAVIALLLKRIGQRLQPRPFMLVSSALLALLVFVLTGNGVHALQEAGVLGMTELPVPDLPLLGVYASAESLAAQGLVFLFLLGSAAWPLFRQGQSGGAQPAH